MPQLDKQQQKETAACDHQGKCPACETAAALFEVSNNGSLAHNWS